MENKIVVCDNGSGYIKCGFASESRPRSENIFPSIVSRPHSLRPWDNKIGDFEVPDIAIGDEAAKFQSMMQNSYPIQNGFIRDWNDVMYLWDYAFSDKLNINTREHRILLSEPILNPKQNRERMLEIMFEKYQFGGVHVAQQPVLALYGKGQPTGVVVDCGDSQTQIVPIYEGITLLQHSRILHLGGRDVTRLLGRLLVLNGYSFNRAADFEILRKIKEELCYVAHDSHEEERLHSETTVMDRYYTLPDERVIKLGREMFTAPESLFNPALQDSDATGLAMSLSFCIRGIDPEIQKMLCNNIVMCGGGSLFPGFASRIEHELQKPGKMRHPCKVSAASHRMQHLVFCGGSILAILMQNCPEFWMSRADYEEKGLDFLLSHWPDIKDLRY